MSLLKRNKSVSPALVLFFLSPIIAELLSSSAPPAEFFHPVIFVVLAVLYGGGAILARELTHRWGKGWPTLLTLGAAYAIVEEGLMVKSFFDPNWMDLGILGSYGRWAGVNWVWSLQLTIYHAVISIGIPVLLVSLMFPQHRSQPWISRRTFKVISVLLVADVIFGFLALTQYRPPFVPYVMAVLVTIGLFMLAKRLPLPKPLFGEIALARARWFGLTGFLAILAFFVIGWGLPQAGLHPLLTMLLMVGLVVLVNKIVLRMVSGSIRWSARHQLALASGALSFFIVLAPLQELNKDRPDNTTGMTVVGLAALLFLIWMARRIRRVEQSEIGAVLD